MSRALVCARSWHRIHTGALIEAEYKEIQADTYTDYGRALPLPESKNVTKMLKQKPPRLQGKVNASLDFCTSIILLGVGHQVAPCSLSRLRPPITLEPKEHGFTVLAMGNSPITDMALVSWPPVDNVSLLIPITDCVLKPFITADSKHTNCWPEPFGAVMREQRGTSIEMYISKFGRDELAWWMTCQTAGPEA
ncbi:hypothetical protein CBL_11795 [Carabus blaptoides fortunei]